MQRTRVPGTKAWTQPPAGFKNLGTTSTPQTAPIGVLNQGNVVSMFGKLALGAVQRIMVRPGRVVKGLSSSRSELLTSGVHHFPDALGAQVRGPGRSTSEFELAKVYKTIASSYLVSLVRFGLSRK